MPLPATKIGSSVTLPWSSTYKFSKRMMSNYFVPLRRLTQKSVKLFKPFSTTKMASFLPEILPPILKSSSEPPKLFDGTIRLYVNYQCPFCQRAWIVRNFKGLQEKIKLVAISLQDRPVWFREKLYPENKVPALEYNGEVIGESLNLIKYIDTNFEGLSLFPDDPDKQKFADEMITYSNTFLKNMFGSSKADDREKQAGAEFDYLETSLRKFEDGPFFLGQLSQVDAVYLPFIERFHIFLREAWGYDVTSGRPKLAAYIEEINMFDAYKQTKCDPEILVPLYKSQYMASN